jgi:hypothetical protein
LDGEGVARFRAKYRRLPFTDSEIAEAERLARVPKKYRTDGDPVPAEAKSATMRAKEDARAKKKRATGE